jgi:hypothetical protein
MFCQLNHLNGEGTPPPPLQPTKIKDGWMNFKEGGKVWRLPNEIEGPHPLSIAESGCFHCESWHGSGFWRLVRLLPKSRLILYACHFIASCGQSRKKIGPPDAHPSLFFVEHFSTYLECCFMTCVECVFLLNNNDVTCYDDDGRWKKFWWWLIITLISLIL